MLLCSDLDRTLLPNGGPPESPGARETFSRIVSLPQIRLAYVSGRNLELVREAIDLYTLPKPDYIIGDVGTTVYQRKGEQYLLDENWQAEIGQDWRDCSRDEVAGLLGTFHDLDLRLQENDRQDRYKVSFYTRSDLDGTAVRGTLLHHLREHGVRASVIWSIDEAEQCGLLDILPERANKLQAIRYLMIKANYSEKDTIFAGDSGNDLEVLTSDLKAILVKNSSPDVRKAAVDGLALKGDTGSLYIARGNFRGMNGNYAAGVLEGLAHFFPGIVRPISDCPAGVHRR